MKQNTGKLVLFTALTVLVFAVFSIVAVINSASANQNATFATTDMDSSGTTDISIGWSTTIVNNGNHSIHVDTSGVATRDYADVGVHTDFVLNASTTISYWGYTVSGSGADVPDELFIMLDTNDDGNTDVALCYTSSGRVGAWVQFYFNGATGPFSGWYTVDDFASVNITDYYGTKVIDVALGAGVPTSFYGVTVDVYLDNLTVNGNTLLDDDSGFIEVHYGRRLGLVIATSIQDAIDAALTGDTIVVYKGTYPERVNVTKQLILRGIDSGSGKPVVDAGGSGSAITLSADDITLEGFTSTNADYGINLRDSCNCTITGNNVCNNNYGINLSDSRNNKIYLNDFINDFNNAYSYFSTNAWNSTEKKTYKYRGGSYTNYMGNYWCDYTGSDTNNDGLGDTSYCIDSDHDYHPLMQPWDNYFAIPIFDTGKGTYPSIAGTHKGTIKSSDIINVSRLYTYSCMGTGGHTEYARIWNATLDVNATWGGYTGDWHNIYFSEPFTLYPNCEYNYTIKTGSYPQIHHKTAFLTTNGWINCTEFVDATGTKYDNWIPAIMLE
jgi:parallel beta-helix repeat protein